MPANVVRLRFGAPPINAGKEWSDMDDSHLPDFDARGISIKETAQFLCREASEVAARIEALMAKAANQGGLFHGNGANGTSTPYDRYRQAGLRTVPCS
jgi:hypothetical protein